MSWLPSGALGDPRVGGLDVVAPSSAPVRAAPRPTHSPLGHLPHHRRANRWRVELSRLNVKALLLQRCSRGFLHRQIARAERRRRNLARQRQVRDAILAHPTVPFRAQACDELLAQPRSPLRADPTSPRSWPGFRRGGDVAAEAVPLLQQPQVPARLLRAQGVPCCGAAQGRGGAQGGGRAAAG